MLDSKNLSPMHKKHLRMLTFNKILVNVARIGLLVAFVIVWELLGKYQLIDTFITSCPSRIWATFCELCSTGTLTHHMWVSTWETLVGFALGTAIGYVVAVLLWWNNFAKKVFEPYIVILNSLPKIALGPLIIIWVGTGKASIITMAVLISVVITTITILNGFVATNAEKLFLLQSLGANKWQIFTKLVAPGNVPTLMSTLKINVGMAWIGTIMGEYLISKEGLGYLIVYGSQVFKLDLVMTCTIVLCALAGIMYFVVAILEKIVCKNFN